MTVEKKEIFIFIVILFLFGFILVQWNFEFTGRIGSNKTTVKSTYAASEIIKGKINLNLEPRDLLPTNSKVKLTLQDKTLLETDLLSFIGNADQSRYGRCDYGIFTNKDQPVFSNIAGYGL